MIFPARETSRSCSWQLVTRDQHSQPPPSPATPWAGCVSGDSADPFPPLPPNPTPPSRARLRFAAGWIFHSNVRHGECAFFMRTWNWIQILIIADAIKWHYKVRRIRVVFYLFGLRKMHGSPQNKMHGATSDLLFINGAVVVAFFVLNIWWFDASHFVPIFDRGWFPDWNCFPSMTLCCIDSNLYEACQIFSLFIWSLND